MKLVHPVLLIALLVTVTIQVAHTINNGLALTPIMGFNTWNQFGHHPNETLLKKTMDNMVKLGLRDIGYKYILIDDCWALSERDHDTQRMVPNPDYFPNGMRHLSNYAHERGLLLGIYTDIGKKTCCYKEEKPGSYEYYDIDAQTYADWNIDYVKVDFCAATKEQGEQPDKFYNFMSEALNKTGRPMVYSICNWGYKAPWTWAPKMSNLWRTTADIHANWREVMRNTDINRRYAKFAKPGEWNDPDLLVVGVKQGTSELNFIQSRTHFSLWAIMASPLILGNDFRVPEQIDPQILEIIMNKDVIAVNQDPLGVQGVVVDESIIGVNMSSGSCQYQPCVRTEVWVKPLERERFSVLLFNRAGMDPEGKGFRHERITLDWVKHLNVSASQEYLVKDLWQNKIYGVYKGQFTSDVLQVQDASMLTLTPV